MLRTGEYTVALQVLTEFYRSATSKLVSAAAAQAIVEDYRQGMRVVSAEEPDLIRAMQLHGEGELQFFDALLLATLGRFGCTKLFSEDMQHRRTYTGVEVINPFVLEEAELKWLLSSRQGAR